MVCPMHCRMFRSLPALHPQAANCTLPSTVLTTKNASRHCPMFPGQTKLSPIRLCWEVRFGNHWSGPSSSQYKYVKVQPREVPDSLILLVTQRRPGGIVFVDTSNPRCYEIVNTQWNTHQAQNQLRPGNLWANTLGPIPVCCPSHLLSIFSKCSQLLSLFRLLHGGLFSLQFLSNLKHKMLSAYVNWKWHGSCLGCMQQGADTLWSSKEPCESSTPSPVFHTKGQKGPKANTFIQDTKSLSLGTTTSRWPSYSQCAVCSVKQDSLLASESGEKTNFSPSIPSADCGETSMQL